MAFSLPAREINGGLSPFPGVLSHDSAQNAPLADAYLKSEAAGASLNFLFSRLCALYLGADASSLRLETAQSLYASLFFTLRCHLSRMGALPPPDTDPDKLLSSARQTLDALLVSGRKRFLSVMLHLPPVRSHPMDETLRSIGSFFSRYDRFFAAHEIPCEIDYQLSLPVPESVLGIEYVLCWLRRFEAESAFLRCFPEKNLHALLSAAVLDWAQTPLNLFSFAFANALGCMLLQKDPVSLSVSCAENRALFARVQRCPDISAQFSGAAALFVQKWSLENVPELSEILQHAVQELSARVQNAPSPDTLSGIFIAFS